MSLCGYEWWAPRIPTPGIPVGLDERASLKAGGLIGNPRSMPQVCTLVKGHDGPHRSSTNVTA